LEDFKILDNIGKAPLFLFIGLFLLTSILLFSPEIFIEDIGLKLRKYEGSL
jgi:hypothetical protein